MNRILPSLLLASVVLFGGCQKDVHEVRRTEPGKYSVDGGGRYSVGTGGYEVQTGRYTPAGDRYSPAADAYGAQTGTYGAKAP